MSFYNDIADDYDEITGAHNRVAPAKAFLEALTSKYAIASALDAACGSGLYAILLAEMGARVVGADISPGMLAEARRRGEAARADVQWVEASMQEMADKIPGEFDAALCMGNSLPHLLTDADLSAALIAFRRLLAPGGVLVIQVLNYARIFARGERIVGIDRHGERLYVRFYDSGGELVCFNILAIDLSVALPAHALHTTTLRPYTHDLITAALARHGFADVQTYGDLSLAPFDPAASDTLVVLAHTPRHEPAP